MLLVDVAVFVLGLVALVAGAEGLVRGGSRLAAALRVSPLVIGLTIASFGTSAPELVVSVVAAYRGDTMIAIGNAVGSNIFNILLVLGPAAVITPMVVKATVVRREVPIMLVAMGAFVGFGLSGTIGRWQGGVLLAGVIAYTGYSYWASRRETREVEKEYAGEYGEETAPSNVTRDVAFVVGGVALLAVGGHFVVESAVSIARTFGVTERVIALTLVAAGTSLPEVATTLVAALRKEVDIAVGNIVGSTIFNSLAIIGTAALVRPLQVPAEAFRLEIPVMLLAGFALLPIVGTRHRVSRWEGALLTAGFVVYLWLLLAGFGGTTAT